MSMEETILRKGEKRYHDLLVNISGIVVETDLIGKILYVSPQCEPVLGYKPEFYIGKSGLQLIHPEDLHKVVERMKGAIIGEIIKLEYRVKKADGSYMFISARGSLAEIKEEKRFTAILRDITERKTIEEELEVSQKELLVLNKINKIFLTISDQEVYGEILSIILNALKSKYGVLGYIDESGNYICPSMTRDIWDKCQMPDKTITFPKSSWGGIWGRAMLEVEVKYSNEPFIVPEGHIQMQNALDVPIIHKGDLIGNILVGNKENGYDKNDIKLLKSIANSISPILYNRLQIERKEQKLKESENKLRKFMDSATDGFVLFDSKLNYIYVNEVSQQIVGRNKEELIGKNILDILPHLKETGRYDKYLEVIKTGEPFSTEDVIYDRTDSSLNSHLSVRAFKVGGDNLGIIFTDITDRKKSEKKIKKIKERIERLTDNADEAIFRVDADGGQVTYANPAAERLFGYSKEEWISDTHLGAKIILPDFVEKQKEIIEELSNTKKPIKNAVLGWRAKDGREVIMEYTIIPIINNDGQIVFFESIGRDITERKKAEQKLKESEKKLRRMMASIPDQISILDRNLNILYLNEVAEEIYGHSALGSKCYQLYHRYEEPCRDCQVKKTFEDGEVHYKECLREVRGDSRYCWCIASVFETNEEGRPISVIDVSRDITERKKREEEMRLQSEIITKMSEGVNLVRSEDSAIIYTNPAFEEKFGYNPGELIGRNVSILNAPTEKTPEIIKKEITESMVETGEWYGEIKNIKKDGTPFWSYANVSLFDNPEHGKVFVSIHTDITERKKREEEIIDEKSKLQTIMDTLQNGLSVQDLDYNILYHNHVAKDMFGDCVGKKCYNIYEGNEKICPECPVELAFEDGKSHTIIRELKNPHSGEISYWENVANPIRNSEGKIVSCLEIATNITERMESEKKLKESKLLIQKTQEIGKIGSFQMELSTNNVIWSDQVYKLFEMKKEGKYIDYEKVLALIHPDDRERAIKESSEAIKNQKPYTLEHRVVHPNGNILNLLITGDVMRNEKNEIIKIGGIIQDITERKKSEEILKESERKLKEAQVLGKLGYWEFDINDQQLTWSDQVFKIYNRDPSLGPPSVEEEATYYTPEINERLKRYARRAIEFGEEFDYDLQANLPSGMVVHLSALMRTIKNRSGQTVKLVGTVQDITERKKADEALKASELMLQKSQTIGQIGSFEMDLTTSDVVWSDQLYKLFGVKKEGRIIDYEKVLALIHPDDRERVIKVSSDAAKELKPYTLEHRVIHPDGEILDLLVTGDVIRNEKNEIIKIGGTIQDITESKKAVEKLKEAEIRYRTTFEQSPDGIMIVDPESTRAIEFNDTMCSLLGYKREEFTRLKVLDYIASEEPLNTNMHAEKLLKEGRNDFETKMRNKQGDIKDIAVTAKTIELVGKKYFQLICRDITEHKKKEDELRLQSEIIINMAEGVYLIRLEDLIIVYTNPRFDEMLGYEPGEMIGRYVVMVNAPTDKTPEEIKDEIVGILKDTGEWHGEVLNVKKDGTHFWCYANVSLFNHPKYGTVIVSVHTDITERKKARDKLKELNRLKSEFLRRASHELKTPLISIKGYSDLILALYKDRLDSTIISKLTEINDGCERLQNIINNLLKTSRLESTNIKPKFQKENLSFLIRFCVHELESLAIARNQSIILDIHSDLDANIEKEEIHDVLSNLIMNAIKYTPPFGKIEINSALLDDSIIISVKDTGIGFTQEQEEKIFQQFGKIERYGQGLDLGIDGTGLGLYISKRIVESHGGKIWMESEGVNKGSIFYFTVPKI